MFKFKGLLRTIGGALGGVGTLMSQLPDPQLMAIGLLLVKAGGVIGGLGVLRAAARNTLS